MQFPQWLKTSAQFVATLVTGTIGPVGYKMLQGKASLKKALRTTHAAKVENTLRTWQSDPDTDARIRQDLDVHTGLLFYCDPHISKKISGLQSADGPDLIQEQDKEFIVWKTGLDDSAKWGKILCEVDPKTHMQMCATYDTKHNDLVMHFGGMDFLKLDDIGNATASIYGGITPRAAAGMDYALKVIHNFKEHYPGITPNTSIIAHSAGAASVPAAIVAATEEGFHVNKTYLLDPSGAEKAFALTAKTTGIDRDILDKNVVTIKANKKGMLDKIAPTASAPVGTLETYDINGHRAENFIVRFNQDRLSK